MPRLKKPRKPRKPKLRPPTVAVTRSYYRGMEARQRKPLFALSVGAEPLFNFESRREADQWAREIRSGIAGGVGGFANLYEAHSFTGRGVMQSYAVGKSLAALLATGSFEEVDLSPLARDRFDDPARWVEEELHI